MKNFILMCASWAALACLPSSLTAADETVSGNLTVTGTVDFLGNTLSQGTRTDTALTPGWQIDYSDGTASTLEFTASRAGNIWKWQQNGGVAPELQMLLTDANALVIFDQSSTPLAKITLNPLGTSFFENSVVLDGSDNQMPFQTLTGSASVLTVDLADQRYVQFSASRAVSMGDDTSAFGNNSLALGEGTYATGTNSLAGGRLSNATGAASTAFGESAYATGAASFAVGSQAEASGNSSAAFGSGLASGSQSFAGGGGTWAEGSLSMAMGYATHAGGSSSFAMGDESQALGISSVAIGREASAGGDYAVSLGYGNTASGLNASAVGYNNWAAGDISIALGNNTVASSYCSIAVGALNIGGGDPTEWVPTDPLFEVGNGQDNVTSNALTIYKNGNATFQGVVEVAPGGDIPMYISE